MIDRDACFIIERRDGARIVSDRFTRPGRARGGHRVVEGRVSHEIYRRRQEALKTEHVSYDRDGLLSVIFDGE